MLLDRFCGKIDEQRGCLCDAVNRSDGARSDVLASRVTLGSPRRTASEQAKFEVLGETWSAFQM